MMVDVYHLFMRGIRWNAIESFVYHFLFLSHTLALYKTIDAKLLGLSSTLLASLYGVAMIANLGLDPSFGPFFKHATRSKSLFRDIIIRQLLIQVGIFLVVSLIFVLAAAYWFSFSSQIDFFVLILVGLTLISEGIKRSLRMLLQLSFMNHATTFIEITMMACYVSCVWGWYFFTGSITITSLLLPLLATSSVGVLWLSSYIYQYFKSLSDHDHEPSPHLWTRIVTTRAFSFIHTVSQQLFSSNLLIPAIAVHSGLAQAGIFNVIATVVSSITNVFHKIGDHTVQAVLAQVKHENMQEKQKAFAFITAELFQIIAAIILFLSINYYKILMFNTKSSSSHAWIVPAYLYLFQMVAGYFIVCYEKLFLNEEHTGFVAGANLATIGACSLLLYIQLSSIGLLAALIIIRILHFFLLMITSYYLWKIKPSFQMRPWFAGLILVISLAFFLIL